LSSFFIQESKLTSYTPYVKRINAWIKESLGKTIKSGGNSDKSYRNMTDFPKNQSKKDDPAKKY
jgi:hypothetical protein